ncbi:MAG: UbiH/UbiF/VisC/COQ6 family ubiquinone biosynthesis hydroxylase [Alphaproteobacteria bacterium]
MTNPGGTNELVATVVVIGGGFAGLTLAKALADAGITTIVVEGEDPARATDTAFDGRASALALASRRIFEALALWPAIVPHAAPILDIRVADGASRLFLHYDHRDVGDEPFGYIVENRHLRIALLDRVPNTAGVAFLAPARVVELDRRPNGAVVTLSDGRIVKASLVVACDGRESLQRQAAGIPVVRWSYRQAGIVCTIAHERPHQGVAVEHFYPAGPFATLPLNDYAGPDEARSAAPHRSSIVWTESLADAQRIMDLDDAGFHAALEQRLGDYLGAVRVIGPRWAYPLSLVHARRYVDDRLALVGDAAHGMHPIAGQGLNMGLRDVAALAEDLVEAWRLGLDLGDRPTLARYERKRRFDNVLMLAATDGLNRLFSNDIAPVRLARDLGLAVVDRMPLVKRLFMRQAMGTLGPLPRLARGEPL